LTLNSQPASSLMDQEKPRPRGGVQPSPSQSNFDLDRSIDRSSIDAEPRSCSNLPSSPLIDVSSSSNVLLLLRQRDRVNHSVESHVVSAEDRKAHTHRPIINLALVEEITSARRQSSAPRRPYLNDRAIDRGKGHCPRASWQSCIVNESRFPRLVCRSRQPGRTAH